MGSPSILASSIACRSERMDQLADALDELPEPQREAVVLRHFQDRSLEEIASRKDVDKATFVTVYGVEAARTSASGLISRAREALAVLDGDTALLDDIAAKNPGELFFNPGSEDKELLEAARAKGLNVIAACSIVNIGLRPDMYPDA